MIHLRAHDASSNTHRWSINMPHHALFQGGETAGHPNETTHCGEQNPCCSYGARSPLPTPFADKQPATCATWGSILRCRQTNFTELAVISCFLISNLGTGLIPKLFKSEGLLDLATKTYKHTRQIIETWEAQFAMTSMGQSTHWVSLARHRRVIDQSSPCS